MTDMSQVTNQVLPTIKDVILGALKANGIGLFNTVAEGKALIDYLKKEAPTKFAGNDIINSVTAQLTAPKEEGTTTTTTPTTTNPENIDLSRVLSSISGITSVLDGLGDKGKQVKQFIYEIAEHIANAAGSGLFGTGQKVNETEARFLADLKRTLSL